MSKSSLFKVSGSVNYADFVTDVLLVTATKKTPQRIPKSEEQTVIEYNLNPSEEKVNKALIRIKLQKNKSTVVTIEDLRRILQHAESIQTKISEGAIVFKDSDSDDVTNIVFDCCI